MPKTALVQARMEPKLKAEADAILASLGINATTAITLFYSQMVRHRGIPIELKVPNEVTVAAMDELRDPSRRKNLKKHNNLTELMADLNSEE
ncbi:MAG: type II toxin-antitoxin system RelB/DinJ family antitoxin [Alphaproteobacteria bacterium]|nr:type II toxin-antitoxin system RelB/DinJ family antitoxin [Alphaproteobacteria bacterium]